MGFLFGQPSVPQVETSARDLLPETKAPEPNSPLFGDSTDYFGAITKRGKDALKITLDSTTP